VSRRRRAGDVPAGRPGSFRPTLQPAIKMIMRIKDVGRSGKKLLTTGEIVAYDLLTPGPLVIF
jgi:hypothetical protein